MARIFLCYRRDDSAGHSGRIFDHLTSRFGAGRVFMDVEGIEAGENFAKVIGASIGSSDTVVVVIGRQWAGINDTSGTKRIDDRSDYVRQEIATTLRLNVELVPVLVGGARFPSQNDLPAELREMAFRNALQIEDDAFLAGMDRLIAVLERTTAASMERKRLTRSTREKKEIATLLLREIASRRDPLRKKDAEPDWFSRTLYLGQHSWSSTWLPRILFYASGLMFLMLLPEIFAADDGKLQWPWVSIDRTALIRTTFCLALAICARGWVKSSEVLRHVHSSRNSIRRAAMLYLPSRRVEWVPQLFFWVALAVLLGLVVRGSLRISLFGLATRTGWIELSAFAALLAFSAQRWSRLYVQRAESELQPASSLASTYTSTRPSVRQPEDPSRDDPSAEVSGVDARWQRS